MNSPMLVNKRKIKDYFFLIFKQLAVANNRIITLQEEMERVKEESSYILESNRKVNLTGFIKYSWRECQCVGGGASRGSNKHSHNIKQTVFTAALSKTGEQWRLGEGGALLTHAQLYRHLQLKQSNSVSYFYVLKIGAVFKC